MTTAQSPQPDTGSRHDGIAAIENWTTGYVDRHPIEVGQLAVGEEGRRTTDEQTRHGSTLAGLAAGQMPG